MTVSLRVAHESFEVGSSSFFKSWFSTIYVRLEQGAWGSLFPATMHELYSGRLSVARIREATDELNAIVAQFSKFAPNEIVWDFEHRDLCPPWRGNIAPDITSLANYFVTSSGRSLHLVLREAFDAGARLRADVVAV